MTRLILRKLLFSLLALWAVATLTFILMKTLPGDPLEQEQTMPKEVLQSLRHHYHLDEPLLQQYTRYIGGLVKGDLGPSFTYKGQSVNEIIGRTFPVSALLGLEALCIAIGTGVTLGTLAALYQGRWQGAAAMGVALLGICLPSFLLAALFQHLFALRLALFPVARWGSIAHSILPALALAALPTGFIARLTRDSMQEELRKDYLKMARSKGVSRRTTLLRHGLRNGILPVFSYLGPLTANILVGSFAVEKIFGIPGLGQWFVKAIANRDYSLIMGMSLFYASLLLATILLVDIAYCWLDPRISLRGKDQEAY